MNAKKTYLKVIVMIFLILVFLIPIALIQNLVHERTSFQQEAIQEVSSKWGNAQTISGPIVSIPYYDFYQDSAKTTRKIVRYAHFLADSLQINGEVFPEMRYRGIYEIVVYNSTIHISGTFSQMNINNIKVLKENLLLQDAYLSLGISDLRGIEEQVNLKWNDKPYGFNSGVESSDVIESGISTRIPLSIDSIGTTKRFDLTLVLKGSQTLNFVPVGKITQVHVSSKWSTPSFTGAFLPDKRDVKASGFAADWKVLHLNRNFPQSWSKNSYNISESAFGVDLLLPVDNYQKTDRAVKYSFMLIALTFLLLFFIELINGVNVHPFQYTLIGLALIIFYSLVLSISEYLSFNMSYIISAVATISLITYYARGVLQNQRFYLLIMSTLIILYGFVFTILQLEDYALLMGSVGLFVILTVVMYYSKKIDWYNIKMQ
ncbi:MAG: cell envelope integrity protein CreD [Bacteroidales bacterium]